MATEVVMPQMGESIAEGTITRWLIEVGEAVERDQPLFEISTDKVDAEIPSPVAGTLLKIVHGDGETVPVDDIVAYIGEAGESVGDGAAAAAASADGEEPAAEAAVDGGSSDEASGEEDSSDGPMSLEQRLRKFSSPLVRNIAAKEGVDLQEVEGTGVHGRVTKKDILGYLENRGSAPAKAASAPGASAAPRPARGAGDFHVPAYAEGENVEVVPMSRIRQITADHMVYSKATSAHVTTVFHIDMSRIARLRQRIKSRFAEANGTKLTYMPFIFSAVTAGLKAFPQLNAAIDGTNIVYKKDVNLGMAVALDHGLIVPVLKNADQLSLVGLAKTANDLADRARSKRLSPDAVKGGTFTVTNPGGFGSLFGTPVINQPQVAILGVGAIEKRPVVLTDAEGNDSLGIRTMCYLALTFDHRLIDGADADQFMALVKEQLQQGSWEELDAYRR